jgi:hypothetical protein
MTTAGDLLAGGALGTPTRFAIGTNGQVLGVTGGALAWTTALTNPMNSVGDTIYGGASGVATRLAAGTAGYVLTAGGAGVAPAWAAAVGFANPMNAAGDLVLGGVSGAAGRLAIGVNGQVLTVAGGTAAWATFVALVNPMTTAGDTIYGGTLGVPTRLAGGSEGQFLKYISGAPSWQTVTIQANPMTTLGDVITGGVSGAQQRLGIGSAGQVLTVSGGAPSWAAPAFVSPMTTVGDLIVGGVSGAAGRLGIGTVGQVLTVSGGTATWQTSTALTNPMTTAGDMLYANAGGTPLRLGVGTAGQVLTVSGGIPAWVAPSGGVAGWLNLYNATAFYMGGESATGWAAIDYATASAASAVPAFGPGQSIVACLFPNATPTGIEMVASHASGASNRGWVLDFGRNAGARRQCGLYLFGMNSSTGVQLTGSDFTVGVAYVIAIVVKADKSVRYSVNGGAVQTIAALAGTYIPPTSADTYNVGSPREFSPTTYPLVSALIGEVRTYSTELSDADLVAACAGRTTGTIPSVASGTVSTDFLPSDFCGGIRVKAQTGVTWLLKGGASLRPV